MYEPDDIDGNEDGEQRRRTDDAVRRQETGSRFVHRHRRLAVAAAVAGCGRRLAVVLVVPLVAWQYNVARSRYGRRLVRGLGQVDIEELGQVWQWKVFQ